MHSLRKLARRTDRAAYHANAAIFTKTVPSLRRLRTVLLDFEPWPEEPAFRRRVLYAAAAVRENLRHDKSSAQGVAKHCKAARDFGHTGAIRLQSPSSPKIEKVPNNKLWLLDPLKKFLAQASGSVVAGTAITALALHPSHAAISALASAVLSLGAFVIVTVGASIKTMNEGQLVTVKTFTGIFISGRKRIENELRRIEAYFHKP